MIPLNSGEKRSESLPNRIALVLVTQRFAFRRPFLCEGADLQLRLISHSYRSAAIFPNEKGLWVKTSRPSVFFTFFLKEWHYAARDDPKVDR